MTTVRPSILGRSALVHFGIRYSFCPAGPGCDLLILRVDAVGGGMKGALIH
jgi:hypothetical protein